MGIVTEKFPGLIEPIPGGSLILTSMDAIINWSRSNSLWPLTFGTSCCAIEMMMCTGAARHDTSRFGSEVARPSPRQADLLVIAGTIVKRMAPRLRMLYEQMDEPKWVMATGSCAISGGPFMYHNYSTIRGADDIIPVDVYVPGCPPRPEAFFHGLLTIQKMIREGETVRKPGERRKPVLDVLPQGVTLQDIQAEMAEILKKENTWNMDKERAKGEHWVHERVDMSQVQPQSPNSKDSQKECPKEAKDGQSESGCCSCSCGK